MKKLSKVLNTFENIMENGEFAPKKQMIHILYFFQIHDKGLILWSKGLRPMFHGGHFVQCSRTVCAINFLVRGITKTFVCDYIEFGPVAQ